jgi:hypothetical protein
VALFRCCQFRHRAAARGRWRHHGLLIMRHSRAGC